MESSSLRLRGLAPDAIRQCLMEGFEEIWDSQRGALREAQPKKLGKGNRTKAEFPCEVNPDKSKLKMLNTCDSTLVDCTWHFDCLQNLPKFYFELRGMFLWCPIGDFPSLS